MFSTPSGHDSVGIIYDVRHSIGKQRPNHRFNSIYKIGQQKKAPPCEQPLTAGTVALSSEAVATYLSNIVPIY